MIISLARGYGSRCRVSSYPAGVLGFDAGVVDERGQCGVAAAQAGGEVDGLLRRRGQSAQLQFEVKEAQFVVDETQTHREVARAQRLVLKVQNALRKKRHIDS